MPIEADLERGSFYNAALELRIRENRFAEAEDLAQRALFHYERAGVAILCFYICVGIVRVNSILPPSAQGWARAVLFLLTNCRRAWPELTPKIAYTYLP